MDLDVCTGRVAKNNNALKGDGSRNEMGGRSMPRVRTIC